MLHVSGGQVDGGHDGSGGRIRLVAYVDGASEISWQIVSPCIRYVLRAERDRAAAVRPPLRARHDLQGDPQFLVPLGRGTYLIRLRIPYSVNAELRYWNGTAC